MAVTRKTIIAAANKWIGKKESDGSFKEIVNIYIDYFEKNKKSFPRGYKPTYKDAWCALFISVLAIVCNATDIIPLEISCGEMIKLAQKMGIWIENDAYEPLPGDIILYDWQDTTGSNKDNTGWPDHIGIVSSITKSTKNMTVIEGNYNDSVKVRDTINKHKMHVNDDCIRGYIVPKYLDEDVKETTPEPPKDLPRDDNNISVYIVKKGDTLTKIAKEYGLSVKQICEWNKDIVNPDVIKIGQKIKLGNVSANPSSTVSKGMMYKVNVNSFLNIRNTPVKQLDGKNIVGKLVNGTIVEVSSINAGWATLADGRGFCCMEENGSHLLIRV